MLVGVAMLAILGVTIAQQGSQASASTTAFRFAIYHYDNLASSRSDALANAPVDSSHGQRSGYRAVSVEVLNGRDRKHLPAVVRRIATNSAHDHPGPHGSMLGHRLGAESPGLIWCFGGDRFAGVGTATFTFYDHFDQWNQSVDGL